MNMERSECKYGTKCYRKQKTHFVSHSHPFVEVIAKRIHKGEIEEVISLGLDSVLLEQAQVVAELIENDEIEINTPTQQQKKKQSSAADDFSPNQETQVNKKIKLSPSALSESASSSSSYHQAIQTVDEKISGASPLSFFLSIIASIPETRNEFSVSFADLLDPSLGILAESVQFNFMVDIGWLLAQYCKHKVQRKPLVVIYGVESEEVETVSKKVPTLKTFRVKPKYPFGSHHTKMALFSYEGGSLRIVVHTGNLIESDWEDRTQGLWISPSCPLACVDTEGPDSETGFKRDLLRYLSAYSLSALDSWMDKIRLCDMSSINVCFLPSVPGSHLEADPMKWGHSHLAQLLQKHNAHNELDSSQIVMQCSSIGSLGPNPNSWLAGELAQSMNNPSKLPVQSPPMNLKVVYPCYQDVISSLHGLAGGGCLPYSRQGHSKQIWFSSFLHKWRSDKQLRTRSMPHIKSYARINSDMNRAFWFALTSANLSKAAWGMKTNKGTSLMIQSYEAGVLFLPKFINKESSFQLNKELLLPYDLPLMRYDSSDEPWFIDNLQ